ncbi:hypothetical protein M8C21_030379 [Ambrosia artemisiifolia]|uniref:Major facilitator superfamily (MFS) profile domain-containing protein n=1 Tax=Ambrosia artemisiifolia TaxID=4212 RepID=A0AAD5GIB6_AMBAR|nr:hypothetical protein M8C21_030379 [Ambrosia artemisiifolia]
MEEGKEDGKINKYSCACSIVASMISIIFGYETGVTSGAMIFIKEDLKINDVQVQVFAGIINFCALIGALSAGRTSDYIGRRYTISLASIIFLLGSLLMGFAPSYVVLLIGRCVAGIGVGFALVIAPVYSAEISATNTRGILASLPEIGISIGILLGLAFGILRMPESPRWLAIQGRLRDTKHVLLKVSNTKDEAQSRLQDIMLAVGIDPDCNDDIVILKQNTRGQGVWKELLLRPTPQVRWVLLAAIGIHFFEHATGIEAVVLYGPRIFKKAGITTNDKLLLANIGVGVTKTIFISASTFFIDKAGRRKLLLISVGGMIVALLGLGFALTIVHQSHDQKLRAQGASIGVAVNRVTNATVSMTFLSLIHAITIGGAFFMFAGMSVLAWIFFFFFLPETKGRSLEEMEQVFTRVKKSRNVDVELQNGNKGVQVLQSENQRTSL